jgi:hypothetical protein
MSADLARVPHRVLRGAKCQSSAEGRRIAIRIRRSLANGERWVLEYLTRVGGSIMTKRRWYRASMVTMMLAATALSQPAFAKAQDGLGFIPPHHLAQNITTAGTPGVAGKAVATQGTAESELVRVLPAAMRRTAALPAAVGVFKRLAALIKRPILTTHSAVTGAGEQDGSENLNGERS